MSSGVEASGETVTNESKRNISPEQMQHLRDITSDPTRCSSFISFLVAEIIEEVPDAYNDERKVLTAAFLGADWAISFKECLELEYWPQDRTSPRYYFEVLQRWKVSAEAAIFQTSEEALAQGDIGRIAMEVEG